MVTRAKAGSDMAVNQKIVKHAVRAAVEMWPERFCIKLTAAMAGQRMYAPAGAVFSHIAPCVRWTLLILATLGSPAAGYAAQFKTLYQFTGGSDGANPMGDLTVLNGVLYGTTEYGGLLNNGVIFKIDPASGLETVVHALEFNEDGGEPFAGLLAYKGKLYGTAAAGGAYQSGTAFEVDPSTGSLTTWHSFNGSTGNDGSGPVAALIEYKGLLYGTTEEGGGIDEGAVFEIDPKTRQESLCLYFDGGSNGGLPFGRLMQKNGMLYGTTSLYPGTVFSIDAATNEYKLVFQLEGPPDHGTAAPYAGLTAVGDTLYGSALGGEHKRGSVYGIKLAQNAFKQMYSFRNSKHDGDYPVSNLMALNSTLYGTTSEGGRARQGIVFGINIATKAETILHEFTGGPDGGDPVAGLVYYDGALYGTTYDGALGYGTVFEVVLEPRGR